MKAQAEWTQLEPGNLVVTMGITCEEPGCGFRVAMQFGALQHYPLPDSQRIGFEDFLSKWVAFEQKAHLPPCTHPLPTEWDWDHWTDELPIDEETTT